MSTKSIDNYIDKKSSFEKLNLRPDILKGIYLYGFNKPSHIQIKGIQAINSKKDCLLQSQSGTGKTATYLLGVLNSLNENKNCQAIIITPTRELGEQVFSVASELSKYSPFKLACCIGGTSIKEGFTDLKNCNVVIGTMGRIKHMIEIGKIKLDHVKLIVLDEADDILSIGYSETVLEFLSKIKGKAQICLISATMSKSVFSVTDTFLNNPTKVLLKKNQVAVDVILQFYINVEIEDYKFETLLDLYNIISTSQTIIFCNTIRKVTWLNDKLLENNFSITTVHGQMNQQERNNIVNEFRQGKTRLLLTTDLLARGIDIPTVSLVINYDLPSARETYIHRIGRSGRFGKKGVSITLVKMEDHMDVKNFNKMKNYYNMNIKELPENISDYLN
jgi:superfamily II DNA/RNA helicase